MTSLYVALGVAMRALPFAVVTTRRILAEDEGDETCG